MCTLPTSTQSSSAGTVLCHARVECRSEVTVSFLVPFQVRLFSPDEVSNGSPVFVLVPDQHRWSETLHVVCNLGQRHARSGLRINCAPIRSVNARHSDGRTDADGWMRTELRSVSPSSVVVAAAAASVVPTAIPHRIITLL